MHSLRLPLFALATLGGLVLWCCSLGGAAPADLVIGNGPDPRTLDPAQAQSIADARVLASLFEGLVVPDPVQGSVAPAMAESWTQSEDGLRWSFTLRAGLHWSDGTELVAQDLVWSFLRFLNPATGARAADILDCVEGALRYRRGQCGPEAVGISAPDSRTVCCVLQQRHPCFLTLLAQFPLYPVPRHAAPGATSGEPAHFVSNGPFRLVFWHLRDRIRVERNPHWRAAESVALRSIDWRCIDSPATILNLYVAGALDIALDVPLAAVPALLADAEHSPGADLRRHARLGTYFLRLRTGQPGFGSAAVRHALQSTIDCESLCRELLRGGETPAAGFVPPGTHCGAANYATASRTAHTAALAAARAELARGLAEQGLSALPPFELLHTTDALDGAIAEWLQQRFALLGVRCNTVALDAQSLRTRMSDGDYAMARSSWVADFDDASNFLECFESTSAANRTGWADAEYDHLLRAARACGDDDASRAATLRQAEAQLLSASPIIPLYHYSSRTLVAPHVEGFTPNPLEWLNTAQLKVRPR